MAATCGDFRAFDVVKRAKDPVELFRLLHHASGAA
jgi:hypothetical protein